jgi:hypothetical protein
VTRALDFCRKSSSNILLICIKGEQLDVCYGKDNSVVTRPVNFYGERQRLTPSNGMRSRRYNIITIP